jgi:hypothetical protein
MARVPGFIKRAPRVDLGRPAVLIDPQGAEIEVVVLDVSSAGFKLEVSKPPRIGDIVTLRVDGSGDVRSQIRWAIGDQAGGIFLDPINSSDFS